MCLTKGATLRSLKRRREWLLQSGSVSGCAMCLDPSWSHAYISICVRCALDESDIIRARLQTVERMLEEATGQSIDELFLVVHGAQEDNVRAIRSRRKAQEEQRVIDLESVSRSIARLEELQQ